MKEDPRSLHVRKRGRAEDWVHVGKQGGGVNPIQRHRDQGETVPSMPSYHFRLTIPKKVPNIMIQSSTPHILFAHGKEGIPWGDKIQRLARVAQEMGFTMESPDFRPWASADKRAQHLTEIALSHQGSLVLVGSSMGAYQAIVASKTLRPQGLFLLAPAVYLSSGEYAQQDPTPYAEKTAIVHGWQDEVVAPEKVFAFAHKHHLPLTMVNDGHRLLQSMDQITQLFTTFLESHVKT